MKRSTFLGSLIGLASLPFVKLKAENPPEWVKRYGLVKTKGVSNIYPEPQHLFDKINVVECVRNKFTYNPKGQVFRTINTDLDVAIVNTRT